MTNNTTKGGHTKTAVAPDPAPNDITTALNQPPFPPAPQAHDIRVEHVPDEIDEAAAEKAFRAWKDFIRNIGRDISKRWDGMADRYKPPHYVYYRCGLQGDPHAEFLFQELKRAGFQLAPKGTYCTLYLSDRGRGVYVCIRQDLYRQFHHIENELIREKNARALRSRKSENLRNLSEMGIEIEDVTEETSTMSAEEFMGGREGVSKRV